MTSSSQSMNELDICTICFSVEELRFYNAQVCNRGMTLSSTISCMRNQFHTVSKQQCVQSELSNLLFHDFIERANGKTWSLSLTCVIHWGSNYSILQELARGSKQDRLLRSTLVTEDWVQNVLPSIGSESKWHLLTAELGNALQMREESRAKRDAVDESHTGPP